jgi:hypothetical protein
VARFRQSLGLSLGLSSEHHWFRPDLDASALIWRWRGLRRDLSVRDYISAELVFKDGLLESYRTLPKPPERRFDSPWF